MLKFHSRLPCKFGGFSGAHCQRAEAERLHDCRAMLAQRAPALGPASARSNALLAISYVRRTENDS